MEKNIKSSMSLSIERKILLILSIIFVSTLIGGWIYSMNLRHRIVAENSVVRADARALVEVERLRNLSDSQISNSLTFFLMGSSNLFDELKKDQKILTESLANFEKKYSLPQVSEIMKRIDSLRQQQQDFFNQAMDFRSKKTESKIVGQFYRAKTAPLRANINKTLNEIIALHNAELDRALTHERETVQAIETQIPQGMAWFTTLLSVLFAGMILLVLRTLQERSRHLTERSRLYEAAKEAIHTRDGILSAVAEDFKDPLDVILQTSKIMEKAQETKPFSDNIEVIKSSVTVIKDRIKDILDQTKADMGNLSLRVEQIGIDVILDETRLLLEPLAKQKDVRLEFNPVNPPLLAFMDRERVMRVLSNLVGNAIKFSPKHSKVIVKVRSDQQFVYISIKDSGPGIPEKQLSEIFNHFWQARKTADQGPGVGLAIAKTVIEAHSGIVSAESHVGHGSIFTFSLPHRRPTGAILRKLTPSPIRLNARPQQQSNTSAERS